MILYTEDPKNATKKQLEFISEFGKFAGYKINTLKSVGFQTMKDQKEKFKK